MTTHLRAASAVAWRQRVPVALVLLVVSAATTAVSLARPRAAVVVVAVGVVVAVAAAAAAAAARDRLTRTASDAPSAGAAARARALAHLVEPADLTDLPALRPGTAPAGAFAHLRRQVGREDAGLIVVTEVVEGSGEPGSVAVWLGANLAITVARSGAREGRRVLLVDGRIGARFGRPVEAEPDTPGLVDVLRGTPLADALSAGPVDCLWALPSGTGREGDAEWPAADLLGERIGEVVAEVRRDFDAAVILAPPLASSEEALLLAGVEGAALLLAVREGRVRLRTLRAAADRARAAGCHVLGVVLTRGAAERDRSWSDAGDVAGAARSPA